MKHSNKSGFVLCIRTDDSDDLEPRKVYQVLPDRLAARENFVRVIDESGEDYLYPASYFIPLKLPVTVAQQLESPSTHDLQSPRPGHRPVRRRLRAVRG